MNQNRTNRNKWYLPAMISLPVLLCAGLLFAWQTISPMSALAQAESGITSPAPDSTVSGTVTIQGTATTESFQRYELYYKPSDGGEAAYVYFDGDDQAVIEGQLGALDATELEPGSYDLRLRVVRADGNYQEYLSTVQVVAPQEQPVVPITVTATLTATEPITDAETVEPTVVPVETVTPTVSAETEQPADLPTDVAQVLAERNINVRSGPGTNYPIISALQTGQSAPVIGQNEAGDWWQIEIFGADGWVLASLVTAQNTGDVPVVATPAPPLTPIATATPVPTSTPIVTPIVTQTEQVTVTQTTTQEVVSAQVVTITGNDADPDALRAFLRTLLAGFGPSNTTVTATIGTLPADLPIELTVPATATVIGGVVRSGDFGGSQLFLTSQGAADDLVAVLRQQFVSAGFTVPSQQAVGGSGQVFLSSDPFALPLVLCSPDAETIVNVGTAQVSGDSEIVSLSTNAGNRFGGPCGEDANGAGAVVDVLPSLAPPPQAQVRGSGSSSSSGSDGFSISAEAEIEADLTAPALSAPYEAQLEDAGWTRLDESSTDDLAWSAWSFSDDEGNEWSAVFYLVRQGGEVDTYLATLRAMTEQ